MIAASLVTDFDVLKAGHHGSETSTSQALVDLARPEYAVISAGLNNQYGHPDSDVVARLQAIGAQLVYTDTAAGDDTKVLTSDCQTYSFSSVPGGGAPTATPTTAPSPSPTATTATVTATPSPTPTRRLPRVFAQEPQQRSQGSTRLGRW